MNLDQLQGTPSDAPVANANYLLSENWAISITNHGGTLSTQYIDL